MPSAVVVDDYPFMRDLLREFLTRAEFDVKGEAGTAAELMEAYPQWRPEILILDILLPDANGAELTRRVLAADPNVKILVISGLDEDAELAEQCIEAGAKAFLAKPFSSEALIRALRAL